MRRRRGSLAKRARDNDVVWRAPVALSFDSAKGLFPRNAVSTSRTLHSEVYSLFHLASLLPFLFHLVLHSSLFPSLSLFFSPFLSLSLSSPLAHPSVILKRSTRQRKTFSFLPLLFFVLRKGLERYATSNSEARNLLPSHNNNNSTRTPARCPDYWTNLRTRPDLYSHFHNKAKYRTAPAIPSSALPRASCIDIFTRRFQVPYSSVAINNFRSDILELYIFRIDVNKQ